MKDTIIQLLPAIIPLGVAVVTLGGSIIAAAVTYYLSKKQQLEEETRKLKAGIYDEFFQAIIEIGREPNGKENSKRFSQAYNKLIFTGSDEIVENIISWWTEVQSKGGQGDYTSPYLKKAIDGMRKDLGLSKAPTIQNSKFTPVGYK